MAEMLLTTEEAKLHKQTRELEDKLAQLRVVAEGVYDWAVILGFSDRVVWKSLGKELGKD